MKADKEIQTEEPPQKVQRTEELANNLAKVIETGFGKVVSAIDWNSRAIKMVERSMKDLTSAVSKVQRAVEEVEKRSSHRGRSRSREGGRRKSSKENQPVLKSVVNKK